MSMTDPIADMLTRIRNALMAEHSVVSLPSSKIKCEIAEILKSEGYITDFHSEDTDNGQGRITIDLKYGPSGERVISGLERVSKPGRRVYLGKREIPDVLGGMGITILSTSRGVLDGRSARQQGVGGEWICKVW